jgi:hypothetical protein
LSTRGRPLDNGPTIAANRAALGPKVLLSGQKWAANRAVSKFTHGCCWSPYTLEGVVVEEWAVFEAAKALLSARGPSSCGLPRGLWMRSSELPSRTSAPIGNWRSSRGSPEPANRALQPDVAAPYAEAGYRVIAAAAVAADAARTLGEEAAIDARTRSRSRRTSCATPAAPMPCAAGRIWRPFVTRSATSRSRRRAAICTRGPRSPAAITSRCDLFRRAIS